VFFGTCVFEELNGFHFSRGSYVNLAKFSRGELFGSLSSFKNLCSLAFFFGKLYGFHLLGGNYLKLSPLLS
jgi:hypothetical protein